MPRLLWELYTLGMIKTFDFVLTKTFSRPKRSLSLSKQFLGSFSILPPSSRGLGHLPFTEGTGIRIPLGVLQFLVLLFLKVILSPRYIPVYGHRRFLQSS